jgi:hypothetical protein
MSDCQVWLANSASYFLRAEAAQPKLAALVGRRGRQCGGESLGLQQSRDEK